MTSSRHYRLKKIRSTFSENRNGIFTSDIEIRMPTTKTDKRIQIFTDDCSKDRDCKLDILSFAVRNFKPRASASPLSPTSGGEKYVNIYLPCAKDKPTNMNTVMCSVNMFLATD